MDISKIGEKIKQKRLEENITQKELASKMNISSQLVSKWETGESVPLLEYIEKLCEVFNVDISYFVGSTAKSKKQINMPKWAWGIIGGMAGAIIIVTFILLCVFVFFPSKPTTPPNKEDEYLKYRETYLTKLSDNAENTLNLNFYNIESTSYLDGDEVKKHIWQGYLDNENIVSYVKTINKKDNEEIIEKEETIKDNIRSSSVYTDSYGEHNFSGGEKYKYDYVKPSNINTIKDMYKHFVSIEEADKTYDITKEDITYIKPTSTGYYIELKDEVFFNLFETNAAKKNLKLNDKIKLEITITNNCIETINITIKYCNIKENEDFESKTTTKYKLTKPVIEHTSLDKKTWIVDLPILSEEEFINTAFSGKAQKVSDEYKEMLYGINLKESNGTYFYVDYDNNQVILLDFSNLSNQTKLSLGNRNYESIHSIFHIYSNNFYFIIRYTSSSGYTIRKLNIQTGVVTDLITITSGPYFNNRYAYTRKEVINLATGKIVKTIDDKTIIFVDSNCNAYYRSNNKICIYGTDISFDDGEIYEEGSSICIRNEVSSGNYVGFFEYDYIIKKYENNTLVETIDTRTQIDELKSNIKRVYINYSETSSGDIRFIPEMYEFNNKYILYSSMRDLILCYDKSNLSRPICICNSEYPTNHNFIKLNNHYLLRFYIGNDSYNCYLVPIE